MDTTCKCSNHQYPVFEAEPPRYTDDFELLSEETVYVAVGSTKPNKIAAAVSALSSVLGEGVEVKGIGFGADSGVDEQPFGAEVALRGCRKRMENLLQAQLDIPTDSIIYYVALENGLFPQEVEQPVAQEFVEANQVFVDRCVAMIRDPNGHTICGESEGPAMPTRFVEASRKSGWTKTAADFLVEEHKEAMPDLKASAWHGSFCPKSREELMTAVLKQGLQAVLEKR